MAKKNRGTMRGTGWAMAIALLAGAAIEAGCVPITQGLAAYEPAHSTGRDPSIIKTLTPTFRWEPYQPSASAKIENLHYHLVVVMAKNDQERERIVLDKSDLTDPTFTFSDPLPNHRVFAWHVRPEFTRDGKLSEESWNGYKTFVFLGIAMGMSGVHPYAFKTEAE